MNCRNRVLWDFYGFIYCLARINAHTYASVGFLSIDTFGDPYRRLSNPFQDTLSRSGIASDVFASFATSHWCRWARIGVTLGFMLMCRGGHKFLNSVWTSLKASMMTMTLVSFPQGTDTWDTPTSLAVLPFGLTFSSLVTALWTTLLTCKMYWIGPGGFLS